MLKMKSPRTPHLSGSGLAGHDTDGDRVQWRTLLERNVVLEEKVDGSEVSFHFDEDANLVLRERANNLDLAQRGGSEKVYDELKDWATLHQDQLFDRLQDRFLVYGMWCLAAHTVAYDKLPAYLLEFDVQDKHTGEFLSTPRRYDLLKGASISHIEVLHQGPMNDEVHPKRLIGRSRYCSENISRSEPWLDTSGRMEGIYGKVETADRVTSRFKWVRADFIQGIIDNKVHWKDRPLVRNSLCT